ncbi:MAG: recombination regulator RecX [Sphaerochaetaceae bacterium]|nr:recombination regulator RecX [Sphaerochaetaceae bacterium]
MTENEKRCIEQALRFLDIREHNRSELKTKLNNKGYEDEVCESALDFLTDEGSLDEERYIRSFIRSNNRRHPEGKVILAQRLAQKGADRNLSKQVLNEVYTEEYTAEITRLAVEKLEKKGKAEDPQVLRASLYKLGLSDKYL